MKKNSRNKLEKMEQRNHQMREERLRLERMAELPVERAPDEAASKHKVGKRRADEVVEGGSDAETRKQDKKERKKVAAAKSTAATGSAPKKHSKKDRDGQKNALVINPPEPPHPPLLRQVILKAEQKVKLGNGRRVEIGGLRDDLAERYVWCREGGRLVLTRYGDWHGHGGDASAVLRAHGLVVVGSMGDIRDAVDQLKRFPRVPIVTGPGWSSYGFVLADGRVLVANGRPEPLKAFTSVRGMLECGGTLRGWMTRVSAMLEMTRDAETRLRVSVALDALAGATG